MTIAVGTYQTYKNDTATFTTWLVSTAKQCGLTVNGEDGPMNGGPKLKGRARKLARDAAKQSNASSDSLKCQMVTTKVLIACAETIAKHKKPPVRLPPDVLAFAKRAIDLRTKYALAHQDLGRKHAEDFHFQQSNSGHSHFINVLKQTLQILRPCYETRRQTVTTPGAHDDFANRFSQLNVEDVSEEFLKDVPQASEPSEYSSQSTGFEVETKEEDRWFKIFCFLEDLSRLRREVCTTWINYREGECDLISASIVTCSALELGERLHNALLETEPELVAWSSIVRALMTRICHSHKADGSGVANVTISFEEWLMSSSGHATEAICRIPFLELPLVWLEDPKEEAKRRCTIDKIPCVGIISSEDNVSWRKDAHQLLTFVAEISIRRLPIEDGIISAWRRHGGDEHPSLPLVFAIQLYRDIHSVLGPEVNRGLGELKALKSEISTVRSIIADVGYLGRPEVFTELADFVQSDVLELYKVQALISTQSHPQAAVALAQKRTPYRLLSQHPTLCGLLILKFKLLTQELARVKTNDRKWFTILGTAHLYNAARQSGACSQPWPDMESVIRSSQDQQVFVGKRPENLADITNRWFIARGVSVTNFSPQNSAKVAARLELGKRLSRGRHRQIAFPSPLFAAMWKIWVSEEDRKTAPRLTTIRNEIFSEVVDALDKCGPHTAALNLGQKELMSRRLASCHPTLFLYWFRWVLVSSAVPDLQFNLLTFDARCSSLLERLWNDANLSQQFRAVGFEHSCRSSVGFQQALDALFAAESAHADAGLCADTATISGHAMLHVKPHIDALVREEGSAEMNKAQEARDKIMAAREKAAQATPDGSNSDPVILPFGGASLDETHNFIC